MVDESQDLLDRGDEPEGTLAMHTAWEGALKTFDLHFPPAKQDKQKTEGSARTLVKADLDELKIRAKQKGLSGQSVEVRAEIQVGDVSVRGFLVLADKETTK